MYVDAYVEAIRPEQVEQAISVAVVTKFNRPHTSLEDCVEAAVEQVFCPCVSHREGEGETAPMSIRAGIVGSIVEYLRQGVCTARDCGDAPRMERDAPEDAERKRRRDEALDDALAQTFPASDPVALSILPSTSQGTRRVSMTQPLQHGGVGGWNRSK